MRLYELLSCEAIEHYADYDAKRQKISDAHAVERERYEKSMSRKILTAIGAKALARRLKF